MQSAKSDAFQGRRQVRDDELAAAEGFVDSAITMLTSDPAILAEDLAEMSGEMVLGGAFGRAMTGLKATGKILAASGFGGVTEAGRVNESLKKELIGMTPAQWSENDDFRRLLENGYSITDAKRAVATDYANRVGAITAGAITVTGAMPVMNELNKVMVGVSPSGMLSKGFDGAFATALAQGVKAGVGEGVQEGVTEGITQATSNVARRKLDGETPIMQGVAEQAGSATVAGALMGAGVSGPNAGFQKRASNVAEAADAAGQQAFEQELRQASDQDRAAAEADAEKQKVDAESRRQAGLFLPAPEAEVGQLQGSNLMDAEARMEPLATDAYPVTPEISISQPDTSTPTPIALESGVMSEPTGRPVELSQLPMDLSTPTPVDSVTPLETDWSSDPLPIDDHMAELSSDRFVGELSKTLAVDFDSLLSDLDEPSTETAASARRVSDAQLALGETAIDTTVASNPEQRRYLEGLKAVQDARIARSGVDLEKARAALAESGKAARKAYREQRSTLTRDRAQVEALIRDTLITNDAVREAPTPEAKRYLETLKAKQAPTLQRLRDQRDTLVDQLAELDRRESANAEAKQQRADRYGEVVNSGSTPGIDAYQTIEPSGVSSPNGPSIQAQPLPTDNEVNYEGNTNGFDASSVDQSYTGLIPGQLQPAVNDAGQPSGVKWDQQQGDHRVFPAASPPATNQPRQPAGVQGTHEQGDPGQISPDVDNVAASVEATNEVERQQHEHEMQSMVESLASRSGGNVEVDMGGFQISKTLRDQFEEGRLGPRDGLYATVAIYNYADKKIYVDPTRIRSAEHLRQKVLHESVHAGLHEKFGDRAGVLSALENIRQSVGVADIRRLRRTLGISLAGYDVDKPENLTRNIEELIAHYGEGSTAMDVAARKFQTWLRRSAKRFHVPYPKGDVGLQQMRDMLEVAENSYALSRGFSNFERSGLRQTPSASVAALRDKSYLEGLGRVRRAKALFRRVLTKERGLDSTAFQRYLEAEGQKRGSERLIDFRQTQLVRAVKKQYPNATTEHYQELNKLLLGKPTEQRFSQDVLDLVDVMRAEMDVRSEGVIRAVEDEMALIEARLTPVQSDKLAIYLQDTARMSAEQRAAHDQVVADNPNATTENGGREPAELRARRRLINTIRNKKGEYIHTSYEVFDNPKWIEKLEQQNPEYITDAIKFKIAEYERDNGTRADYQEMTPTEARNILMDSLTRMGEQGPSKGGVAGGNYAEKDVSILRRQGEIPVEIRKLMGEYTDIRINYTKTMSKIDNYLANHRFTHTVYHHALSTGLIFDRADGLGPGEKLVKIHGRSNKTYSPLNGMWSTPELAQALRSIGDVEMADGFWRAWQKVNSAVKYGKTVLSIETQLVNFISNGAMLMANGHALNPKQVASTFKLVGKEFINKSSEDQTRYVIDLMERGVFGDGANANEIKKAINDVISTDQAIDDHPLMAGTRGFMRFMERSYGLGDDFAKIIAYETELANFKKRKRNGQPRYTEDEAKSLAAERVRDGYPTYGMVPKLIQQTRNFPLAGTFVSFPWEVMRVSKNHFKMAYSDYKEGDVASASRRVLGMIIAHSFFGGLAAVSLSSLDDFDEEDDKNFKKMQGAPWNRNATYVYHGLDENGQPEYIDATRYNMFAYVQEPIRAMFNETLGNPLERGAFAFSQFVDPYIGGEIFVTAMAQAYVGVDQWGQPIFDKTLDSKPEQAVKQANHVIKAVLPTSAKRLLSSSEAHKGELVRGGRQITTWGSIGEMFGWRNRIVNVPDLLGSAAYSLSSDKPALTGELVKSVAKINVSDEDIAEAVDQFMTRRTKVYESMANFVETAAGMGMSLSQIEERLRGSGLSKHEAHLLGRGRIPDWTMSDGFMEKQMDRLMATARTDEEKRRLRSELPRRKQTIKKLVRKWEP